MTQSSILNHSRVLRCVCVICYIRLRCFKDLLLVTWTRVDSSKVYDVVGHLSNVFWWVPVDYSTEIAEIQIKVWKCKIAHACNGVGQ